jgi:DNA-directed RNA polymerase specialized sigma subunit
LPYLDKTKDRDAGIIAAIREGQHSMTDIAAAVELSVSRVSRIIAKKLATEAKGKA